MAADFLDEKRSEIAARLKELEPLVDEYQRLDAAAAALDTVPAAEGNGSGSTEQASARVKASPRSTKRDAPRRGRPKGTGHRRDEALAMVKAHPGIKVSDIASRLEMSPNYLYRVLPGLAEEGLVTKDEDGGWYPVVTPAPIP
jgi:DNA-binding transcriptional ArsR family regulator